MLDPLDYLELPCNLCQAKQIVQPDAELPNGRIDVRRMLNKVDEAYRRNDLESAHRVLIFWQQEAASLNDKSGELSVVDEMLGVYRVLGWYDQAMAAVQRAQQLIVALGEVPGASMGTVYLNLATTFKAFGQAQEAMAWYDRAEAVYTQYLPSNDPLWAGLNNNKALALVDLRQYAQADACYQRAIDIGLSGDVAQRLNVAVTYVNRAYLYEAWQGADSKVITDSLYAAYQLLTDEALPQDTGLAFVLSKCYPAYQHYGYRLIADQLKTQSEVLYARA